MKRLAIVLLALLGFGAAVLLLPPRDFIADPENVLLIDLKFGQVQVRLRPDKAPLAVARVKELARKGFYDGLTWHRVIPGFMAQGGDPNGDGTGGSGQQIPDEFNDLPFLRGTMGMARAQMPDTGDSQFFICFVRKPELDGNYTAIGQVIGGMEFLDRLKKGDEMIDMGLVSDPDRILHMRVAADVPGARLQRHKR